MPHTSPTSLLEALASRAKQLYSLPVVVVQVLKLTNSPQVDVQALKECLENDPALVSKVLRVVNSSIYGLSQPVSDLNQALALLGIKPLKLLVLGFSLPPELLGRLDAELLGHYWQRSLTRAVAAREIATKLFRHDGDEAYVAGLLLEIGQLVLVEQVGQPYTRFVQSVQMHGASLALHESQALGFDHAELSSRLLRQWAFPKVMTEAVSAVHHLEVIEKLVPPARQLASILHLAELTTQLFTQNREEYLHSIMRLGKQFCGMTFNQYEEIVRSLAPKVGALTEIYSLELPEHESFEEILQRAQSQIALVAEGAVADMISESPEETLWEQARDLAQAIHCFHASGQPRRANVSGTQEHKKSDQAVAEMVDAIFPSTGGEPDQPAARSAVAKRPQQQLSVALDESLALAIRDCRHARTPLSLLSIAFDQPEELASAQSLQHCNQHLKRLIAKLVPPGSEIVVEETEGISLILRKHDREESLDIARELLRGVNLWTQQRIEQEEPPLSISIGIASLAMAPKNFPAAEMIAAAARCRSAGGAANGNTVKSISM